MRDNNEKKKKPCHTKLCAFRCLIARPQINSKSEVSKSNPWEITSFSKTTPLQREPFLNIRSNYFYFKIKSCVFFLHVLVKLSQLIKCVPYLSICFTCLLISSKQNIRIKADFAGEYFEVLHSTVNGTYHHIRALQSGLTEIEAALVSIVKPVSC